MDVIKNVGAAFLWGMCDSVKGMITVFRFDKELKRQQSAKRLSPIHSSSPIRHRESLSRDHTPVRDEKNKNSSLLTRVGSCALINGGVFLLSILLFNYAFMPLLELGINIGFGSRAPTIWYWINLVLTCGFHTLWVVPLFAVTKIINSLWFQDIGQTVYKCSRGRSNVSLGLSKTIADYIFSCVVETLFLIQAAMMIYIPVNYLGDALYVIHISLLYSLYAFEYQWTEMGWEIHTRLNCIETHWAYFLGFGMPLGLCSQLSSSWAINGAVFSLLFPIYIVSASEATPTLESRIKIFAPVVALANAAFNTLRKEKKLTARRPVSQPRR